MSKISFLVIAGDSGGHILPAIKYINELSKIREPEKILFITNEIGSKFKDRIENKKVKICIFKSKNRILYILKILKFLSPIFIKNNKIKSIGFGGFITLPVLYLSKFFNIIFLKSNEIFVHEQNYILGLANKINSKIADKIFTSFPSEKINKKEIYVGNFFKDLDVDFKEIDDGFVNILLLGGSGGSLDLNNLLLHKLQNIDNKYLSKLKLSVQIPETYLNEYKEKYLKILENVNFFSFENNLNYKNYDLIISRSGSGSINDILYFTNIAFFLPHLHSRDRHQSLNLNFFKKYIKILESLEIPLKKKEYDEYYINSLINPYSINKIVCYLTR